MPATGSVAAMITKATGRDPYFVGKPNPMMFRSALNRIEAHSESTMMVGDRMDTDVVAGIEAAVHRRFARRRTADVSRCVERSRRVGADLRVRPTAGPRRIAAAEPGQKEPKDRARRLLHAHARSVPPLAGLQRGRFAASRKTAPSA